MKRKAGVLLFWLLFWQTAAWYIHRPVFLVGPWETLLALGRLACRAEFWRAVFASLYRIGTGFFLAFLAGLVFGGLAYVRTFFRDLLRPVILLMKTVPVASFVILALLWTGAEQMTLVISFFVVFPMIYLNTLAGLQAADPQLLEMAQVFHIRPLPKLWQIYRPALAPFLSGACRMALGMSWKSGIAAEVIGTPNHSIGERLYMAKIFFDTDELFAWTAVVVLLSFLFEKAVLAFLNRVGICEGEGGARKGKPKNRIG
jgi:NitT/TauT family transport system permease protein